MSEILLKVPEEVEAEFVNQGNFEAQLTAGKTISITSRKFADYLIREFGLEEQPTTAESLATELGKLKVGELVVKAQELNIEKANSLKKGELIEAIVKATLPPSGEQKLNDGGNE